MAESPNRRRKLKVLTLVDYLTTTGGAERLAIDISTRLDQSRFSPSICSTRVVPVDRSGPAQARAQLDAAGVPLRALDRPSRLHVGPWGSLLTDIRRQRMDIIHAHKVGSNAWASVLGRLAPVPVVVAHEHTWSFEGQPWRRFVDRCLIAPNANVMIAVSREDRRRMIEVERIPPEKVVFVPNGVPDTAAVSGRDLRPELGIGPDDPVIGIACVLRPQKNVSVLLRAAARLRREFPRLRVLIAGEGEERAALERLAAELGLAEAVRFLGFRTDVPDVLAAWDVALLSSRYEGSPLALMEYMEAGKPVVAPRVGGVPDLVAGGEQGLLVEPGDPEALATATAALLRDPARARRMGERGRARCRAEFGIDVTVRRIEDLYEQLYRESGDGSARRTPGRRVRR